MNLVSKSAVIQTKHDIWRNSLFCKLSTPLPLILVFIFKKGGGVFYLVSDAYFSLGYVEIRLDFPAGSGKVLG